MAFGGKQVGRLYVEFDANGKPYVKGLKGIEQETHASGRRMEGAWKKYGMAAGVAAAAGLALITAAVVKIGTASVKAAASFEFEMSRIKANAQGTAAEMKKLQSTVIELGKQTMFSAGETAQAANELVKAGLSVAQTIEALPGMLNLAAAGELSVAQAATITADALNVFNIPASKAAMVADVLALAANRSTTEVGELGEAFSAGASVAAMAGMTIQEFNAVLAILANYGIKGADAGTMLKTMFMQVMAPSSAATAEMEKYGLSVYDATGSMLPFLDVIRNLEEGLKGATEEQRNFALGTVFGTRGITVVNNLLTEGSDSFEEWIDLLSESGAASDIAATKLDNLAGSWEQLRGSMETLVIKIGTPLLGDVREFVDDLKDAVDIAIETGDWGAVVEKLSETIGEGVSRAIELIAPLIIPVTLDIAWGGAKGWGKTLVEGAVQVWRDVYAALASDLGYKGVTDPAVQELGRLIALGDELDRTWQRQSQQAAAVADGMSAQAQEAARLAAETEDLAAETERLAAETERLAPYIAGLTTAYEQIVDPTDAWTKAVEASAKAAGIAVEDYDAAKTSLTEWMDELEKGLANWANYEANLKALVSQGLSVQAAVLLTADQAAALVGGTPEQRKRAFATLEKSLTKDIEALALNLELVAKRAADKAVGWDIYEPSPGNDTALADAAAAAVGTYAAAAQIELDKHVLDPSTFGTVSMADEGEAGAKTYKSGFDAYMAAHKLTLKGLGFFPGLAPAGGATAAELLKSFALQQGKVGGLASSTGNVWTTLKGIFPGATWMGGYATSGHVTNSDHYTGHAFDVGGSTALMQSMANLLARNMEAWGLKYIIYNREVNRGGGWVPYRGSNPHTGHVHVSTYGMGGWVLPQAQKSTGQEVPAILHAGEYVLTQNQAAAVLGSAQSYATGGWVAPASSYESYIAREMARYASQQAMAGDYISAAELALLTATLDRQIGFLNVAVAEAQRTLDAAKAKGSLGQINEAAEALFRLQEDAADARQELEALARVPLDNAVRKWANAIGQFNTMMSLVGNSSNALALQTALLPSLMGSMGGSYQTSMDLMNASTDPNAIMDYATDAIDTLSSMFDAEQSIIDRALSDTLSSINSQEQAWSDAWSARADALDDSIARQREALNDQLEDLNRAQQAELDSLNEFYDARLRAMQDADTAITREQQRNAATRRVGSLEDQLRILRGQGYYTEADIARMRELETQISDQHDAMVQQDQAWAREDERTRLEDEKATAIKSLEQQQESQRIALQDQIDAAQRALEAQRQAFEQQRAAQQQAFERQREQARQAAQAEIDRLVEKYQRMMQEVMDRQNELLSKVGDYQNAGYALGQAFAQGLLDALPAIQAAANAAAAAAAASLKLASPAQIGPLSDLDHWFDAFVPTLLKPLRWDDLGQASMDTASAVRGAVTRNEERVDVYLHNEVSNQNMDALADAVSAKINHKVKVAHWGHGS